MPNMNFARKKIISLALIMENPVNNPIVPPTAANISKNFALLSLVILSNVGVSNLIWTYLKVFFHSYSSQNNKLQIRKLMKIHRTYF